MTSQELHNNVLENSPRNPLMFLLLGWTLCVYLYHLYGPGLEDVSGQVECVNLVIKNCLRKKSKLHAAAIKRHVEIKTS